MRFHKIIRISRHASRADNADEPIHPDTRSSPSSFIWSVSVPLKWPQKRFQKCQMKLDELVGADLSASVDFPLSGLFSQCALSRPAPIMQFYKIRRMMKSAPPLSPPSLRSGQALSHTCSERSEEAAKGLSRWAEGCFATLSMTVL